MLKWGEHWRGEKAVPPPFPKLPFTYMNRHVEVIRFERISHLPESTQGIISVRLFKAERLVRFAAFLGGENEEEPCGRRTLRKPFHTSLPTRHIAIWWWDFFFSFFFLNISVPVWDTWGTSSLLWGRRAEEGWGRRCGSCRHSRHIATDGPPLPRCHTSDTQRDPPAKPRQPWLLGKDVSTMLL